MKFIRRLTILLITPFIIGFFASCKTTRVPELSKSINRDSTTVIIKERPVFIPGATVYKKLNIDSLRVLFGNGKVERYVTTTDVKGLTRLESRLDLVTGLFEQRCITADSMLFVRDTTINRLTEKLNEYQKPSKEESKSWIGNQIDKAGTFLFNILIFLGLIAIVLIIWKIVWRK